MGLKLHTNDPNNITNLMTLHFPEGKRLVRRSFLLATQLAFQHADMYFFRIIIRKPSNPQSYTYFEI